MTPNQPNGERHSTLAIPADASFDDWLNTGRQLARMHRHLGFMVGDWVNHGREHFPEQITLALELADIDERYAVKASHVSRMFPPASRAHSLSFDHHRAVIKLPPPERLEVLAQADKQHWKIADIREEVVKRRYEAGSLFDDEDIHSNLCSQVVRAWNRATTEARELFMTLATAADLGVIDEDEVIYEPES